MVELVRQWNNIQEHGGVTYFYYFNTFCKKQFAQKRLTGCKIPPDKQHPVQPPPPAGSSPVPGSLSLPDAAALTPPHRRRSGTRGPAPPATGRNGTPAQVSQESPSVIPSCGPWPPLPDVWQGPIDRAAR